MFLNHAGDVMLIYVFNSFFVVVVVDLLEGVLFYNYYMIVCILYYDGKFSSIFDRWHISRRRKGT